MIVEEDAVEIVEFSRQMEQYQVFILPNFSILIADLC